MAEKLETSQQLPRLTMGGGGIGINDLKAPTLQFLLPLYLFVLAFILGAGWPWPYDPDIWWHLKTGEWIVAHGSVPWADPFGANTHGERWIAYSWLAEVLFYKVDQLAPNLGLHVLQGGVVGASIAILFVHARAVSGSLKLALLLCGIFLVPIMSWTARPQIFSFLFVAFTMLVLWQGGHKNRNAWWMLPPLMMLWANIHVYFIVGLGLVFVMVGEPWLRWFKGASGGQRPPRSDLALLMLCTTAPLLNPYGYHLYTEVYALAGHGASGWAADSIRELASPSFHDWPMKMFFAWIMLGMLAFIVSDRCPKGTSLFLFGGLLYQSLLHLRDIPYFVIVMLPIYAYHLAGVASLRWQRLIAIGKPYFTFAPQPRLPALLHSILALGAVSVLVVLILRMGNLTPAEAEQHRDSFGLEKATRYLTGHQLPGPLYHPLAWGGYLIYRLAPAYKVYIDGRTQLYSRDFWKAHDDVRYGKPDWYARLVASGANTVLWKKDEPLASLLRLVPDWAVVYEDDKWIIFVRRSVMK